ncbi:hypothetical protein ACFV2H_24885 [Streptomyces sp. NPDC059629]|uniref:hypothetical protein n=1 Tax=Streptomyces sp. NPDC059629 TaxID=3346889 RepID=UPI0036CF4A78
MIESWVIDDGSGESVLLDNVAEALRARFADGRCETWLRSSSGRLLAFLTNGERASVSLLEGEGEPGQHAIAPGATGASLGFILSNGQHDEYADEETVPLAEALRIVVHIVGQGVWPSDACRLDDR